MKGTVTIARPLRARVALTALAVLAVWVLLATAVVDLVVLHRLHAEADTVLSTRAQAAATTVDHLPRGGLRVRSGADDAAVDVGTWVFEGSRVLERPAAAGSLDRQAVLLTGRGPVFTETGGPGGLRWYGEPVLESGRQVGTVVTSLSLAPYRSSEQTLLLGTGSLAVLLLGVAYLVIRAGVGRALRPVTAMTHQAARWSVDDVDRRFGSERRPAELEDLAGTLDGLLDRVSAVLRHERDFSAQVSHELRTPLARVLGEVEWLRQRPHPADVTRSGLAAIEAGAGEMSEILESLMAAARTVSRPAAGRCDAVSTVRALLDRRPERSMIRFLPAGPAVAGVDPAVLQRSLSPLVDNAVRFARSAVEVRVHADRGVVVVEVADDGPGITAEDLSRVFEPGQRGGPDDGHDGAGLGLALVRRLVTSAGGSVRAGSTVHGAVFVVVLPAG